jgi:hypothetical protein
VCDGKIYYQGSESLWDRNSKSILCSWCAVELAKRGVFVHDEQELEEWMEKGDPWRVVSVLREVGFQTCDYENPIDERYYRLVDSSEV